MKPNKLLISSIIIVICLLLSSCNLFKGPPPLYVPEMEEEEAVVEEVNQEDAVISVNDFCSRTKFIHAGMNGSLEKLKDGQKDGSVSWMAYYNVVNEAIYEDAQECYVEHSYGKWKYNAEFENDNLDEDAANLAKRISKCLDLELEYSDEPGPFWNIYTDNIKYSIWYDIESDKTILTITL